MTETLVLVGTAKGLFTLRSSDGRQRFEVDGPGAPRRGGLRHLHRHPRPAPRLFAGSVSMHWGPVIRRSDDLGATVDRAGPRRRSRSRPTPAPR